MGFFDGVGPLFGRRSLGAIVLDTRLAVVEGLADGTADGGSEVEVPVDDGWVREGEGKVGLAGLGLADEQDGL